MRRIVTMFITHTCTHTALDEVADDSGIARSSRWPLPCSLLLSFPSPSHWLLCHQSSSFFAVSFEFLFAAHSCACDSHYFILYLFFAFFPYFFWFTLSISIHPSFKVSSVNHDKQSSVFNPDTPPKILHGWSIVP